MFGSILAKRVVEPTKAANIIPDEVASEMGKLQSKLEAMGHPLAKLPETLAPLLGARGSRGWKQDLEKAILDLTPGDKLKVAAVLAHETAFREIDAVLNIADALSDYFPVDFKLILTHWEYLSNPAAEEVFETIAEGILSRLKSRALNSEFIPVDRNSIRESTPFVRAREEIWDRVEGTPCVEDFKWMVDFYSRQYSYRPEGMEQALRDLTMRRGIGLLIEEIDPKIAVLTEMKERLSRCYRCPCPVLNAKI